MKINLDKVCYGVALLLGVLLVLVALGFIVAISYFPFYAISLWFSK